MVNRDASRCFAGRDSGGRVRHAKAGRDGSPDNAGRRRVVPRLWPDGRNHRRSRCDRDRTGCRSPPGRGSVRRGTAVPGWGRRDRIGRAADDGRGNSCDIAPACVPRHGVVHGAEAKPGSWARRRVYRQWCGSGAVSASHLNPTLSSVALPRTRRSPPTHNGGTRIRPALRRRGWPSGFTRTTERRQIYADSHSHRHVPPGTFDPDCIHTAGIYVDRVVKSTVNEKRIEKLTTRPKEIV